MLHTLHSLPLIAILSRSQPATLLWALLLDRAPILIIAPLFSPPRPIMASISSSGMMAIQTTRGQSLSRTMSPTRLFSIPTNMSFQLSAAIWQAVVLQVVAPIVISPRLFSQPCPSLTTISCSGTTASPIIRAPSWF